MKTVLKRYLIITLSFLLLTQVITAVKLNVSLTELLKSTFILTFIHYIFRPLANLIALPINILTMNLFSWLINIMVFYLWTVVTPKLEIRSWHFPGIANGQFSLSPMDFPSWQVLILSAIILTVFIKLFEWVIK